MKKLLFILSLFIAFAVQGQTIQRVTLLDTTKANGTRIIVTWNGNGLWQIEDSTDQYISINNSGLLCQVYVKVITGNDTIPTTGVMREGVWIPMANIRARFENYYTSSIMRNKIEKELKYISRRKMGEFIKR